ncbi:MAG: ATP-binding protein [Methanoregula sp.]|nr:ATP-binding protein [Methanoregula sp.]
MSWQYSPLAVILAIAAVFLCGFVFFAWKRRHIPGVFPILVFLVAATVWLGTSAVSLAHTDLTTVVIMDWIAYPAIVTIPIMFLLFALWYTEHDSRPSRFFIVMLFVIPVLSIILLLTNDLHSLYYTAFVPVDGPRGTILWTFSRGPLFWITGSYSCVLIMTAILLFVLRYRTVGAVFRTQISLILAAVAIPLIAILFYFLDLGPVPGFDWTPVTFVISGFALMAATLYFELFSLQPLTHSLLVRTMKDGVVATNADGCITLINPAGSGLLGVTEDKGAGRPLADFTPGLDRFIRSSGSVSGPEGTEITLPLSGSSRIYDVHNVTIPHESGHGGGHILVLRDITDRKNAESSVAKANRKLNLLSGIVRHDVKNKLTALFLYLDLASECKAEDERREDLARVRASADGIRNLVDFTQKYQDLGVAAPTWQNVGEILKEAKSHLNCSGIRVVDETNGLELLADNLFERVIYNLLDNALRYARGMQTFSVRYMLKDDALTLYAEDDGQGVPDDEKERIFERGFGKNTGLGLFLVREILGITEITIRETGEPGKGARFEMTVPPGAFRFSRQ